MSPAESTRLFRANLKNLWQRAPWMPLMTIWFVPRLEAVFAVDCHNAGLSLPEIAPVVANTLRWSWRRNRLNHAVDQDWLRSLAAARKHQTKLGAPPGGYAYEPPADTPPNDPRIRIVTRRATAFEPAGANPVIDRATRTRVRRQRLTPLKAPAAFDWRMFLSEHWLSLFSQLFRARRIDTAEADGELGRTLAVAWHAVLDERAKLGDASVGPAQRRWYALLRSLDHVGLPVPVKTPGRSWPPSPGRTPVGHPSDNDAWLAGLCAKAVAKRS